MQNPTNPGWELIDITKRFPGVLANDSISLRISGGEIHGLLGENGCGKTTLIKTLSGAHRPDSGTILHDGRPVVLASPTAARAAGIATVFQEFSIVPTLTVAENICLGRWPGRAALIDWQEMRRKAQQVLGEMELALDPDRTVSTLSVAGQQMVEIAKALAANATLLILDEPTTALGVEEIAHLHKLLRRLKARGTAILYISHRLDEVVEIVDRVTILKDGRVSAAAEGAAITVPFIVQSMVGDVGDHYPKESHATEELILQVRELHTANRVRGATFDLRRGEVFGLGGVLGAGRTEIARALFGLDPVSSGEIIWKGRSRRFASPREAIAAGFGFVPENRKFDGLFFNLSGFPNLTSAALPKLARYGCLSFNREAEAGRRLLRDLQVTAAAEQRDVGTLSGGNQQKLVIGRWLFADTELFILDEPTQGIDIGAKVAVYRLINQLTRAGRSVILISSDYDELVAMSDRIGIVVQGRIESIRAAAEVTRADLMRAAAQEESELSGAAA